MPCVRKLACQVCVCSGDTSSEPTASEPAVIEHAASEPAAPEPAALGPAAVRRAARGHQLQHLPPARATRRCTRSQTSTQPDPQPPQLATAGLPSAPSGLECAHAASAAPDILLVPFAHVATATQSGGRQAVPSCRPRGTMRSCGTSQQNADRDDKRYAPEQGCKDSADANRVSKRRRSRSSGARGAAPASLVSGESQSPASCGITDAGACQRGAITARQGHERDSAAGEAAANVDVSHASPGRVVRHASFVVQHLCSRPVGRACVMPRS